MAAREINYSVEYAKTGRSTCAGSKKAIKEGALRIGRSFPSPFHDGYITKYYLPGPFFKKFQKNVTSTTQFRGLDSLRPADQQMLRGLVGEEPETSGATDQEVRGTTFSWQLSEHKNLQSVVGTERLSEQKLPTQGTQVEPGDQRVPPFAQGFSLTRPGELPLEAKIPSFLGWRMAFFMAELLVLLALRQPQEIAKWASKMAFISATQSCSGVGVVTKGLLLSSIHGKEESWPVSTLSFLNCQRKQQSVLLLRKRKPSTIIRGTLNSL